MKKGKIQKLSVISLILSLFPAISYIFPIFEISLTGVVQTIIVAANIICALAGFILSIFCIKKNETCNVLNIISAIVCTLWLLLITGFVILALVLSFVK